MKIEIDNVGCDLPESYDELALSDKLSIVKLLSTRKTSTGSMQGAQGSPIDNTLVFVEMLKILLRTAYKNQKAKLSFAKWWNGLVMSPEQIYALESRMKWLFEKPDSGFEGFTLGKTKYLAVKARFEHTNSAEFTEGLMDFIDMGTGDEAALDRLIANFCRPKRKDLEEFRNSKDWNGDVREVYNRQRAIDLGERIKDLDVGLKILFLWYYDGLLKAFFDEYEELFGGGGEKRYDDGRGYLMVLKNAAKSHYLGDFKAVQSEDINVVYSLLLDDYYDSKSVK